MVRSLNGLSTGSVRSLNGLNVDTITADLPVLITNRNITLKGLNGLGTAGQIIKVNSGANGLEYANETDTVNTFSSPLVLTGSNVKLGTLTDFGTTGQIIKSTGTGLQYANETDTVYTVATPLSLSGGNEISITQSKFTTATDFFDADFIPFFKTEGGLFKKIQRLAFLTNINYLGVSPIVKNNTSFSYELDFTGLTANGDTITDASEFLISTDAAKTIKSLTYLNLKNAIYSTFNIGTVPPVLITTDRTISLDMSPLSFSTGLNGNDEFLFSLPGGSNWRRITFSTLASLISSQSAVNVNDFGTGTQTGTRTLGNATYNTIIQGALPIVFSTGTSSNNCVLKLNNVNSSVANFANNAIVGFFSLSGVDRVYLGNATNDSELFSDLTFGKKLNCSFGDGNFLFGVSNARIRIASGSNAVNPVIEIFSENTAGVAHGAFIFGDISNDLNLTTQDASRFTVILNQLKPTNSLHLTNLSSSGTVAMKYYFGSSTTSTSTVAWRNQINSNGNYHWDFATNTAGAGNWATKGFINFSVTGVPQMNFTGQHRCVPLEENLYDNVNDYIGYVVETTGQYNSINFEEEEQETILEDTIEGHIDIKTNEWIDEQIVYTPIKKKIGKMINSNEPTINEAQPIIRLTTTAKSKKVYGVISSSEDGLNRTFSSGCFVSDLGERNDNRLFINSIGEGGIKCCNQNGNIENGDLLCSSDIAGIAMKQDTDFIMNYTIGKATQDYNFIDSEERKLIGCVYYCG